MIRPSHLNQKEMHMFWGFLILSALGLTFVKLGSYSVWMAVFATGFKMALFVIALLVFFLIRKKLPRKDDKAITHKSESLI